MAIPTPAEMADAISSIYSAINDAELIEDFYGPLSGLCQKLRGQKGDKKWVVYIGPEAPIIFKGAVDKNDTPIKIKLIANLEIDPACEDFHFAKGSSAVEIFYEDDLNEETPLARWHFDFCNPTQSSPKMHMQYGGHFVGNTDRSKEIPLKEPRWQHPIFDIILLGEVIVANFFESKWKELRQQPNWAPSISRSELLCFDPYIKKLTASLGISSSTVLNDMWSDSWIK